MFLVLHPNYFSSSSVPFCQSDIPLFLPSIHSDSPPSFFPIYLLSNVLSQACLSFYPQAFMLFCVIQHHKEGLIKMLFCFFKFTHVMHN